MSSAPIEVRFDKRLNNLEIVHQANSGSRSEYFVVAFLALLMIIGCLAYGWQHYQYLDLEYRAGKARKERVELEKKHETLRSDRQTWRSSDRLFELAPKLGLKGPEPGQIRPAPSLESVSDDRETVLN